MQHIKENWTLKCISCEKRIYLNSEETKLVIETEKGLEELKRSLNYKNMKISVLMMIEKNTKCCKKPHLTLGVK